MPDASFKVTLEGLVDLNGLPKEELEHHLRIGLMNAIGNGLITGHTEAEVDGYQLGVSVTELGPDAGEDETVERISEEDFLEIYRPIRTEQEGVYGLKNLESVDVLVNMKGLGDDSIWTIVDGGDALYAQAGLRTENKMCYIVTEKPWRTGEEEAIWHEVKS